MSITTKRILFLAIGLVIVVLFLYPRLGFGQIVERLADDAVDAGARIDTAVTATALSPSDRRVQ